VSSSQPCRAQHIAVLPSMAQTTEKSEVIEPQSGTSDEVAAADASTGTTPHSETPEVSEAAPMGGVEMPQPAAEAMAGTAPEAEKSEVSEAVPPDAEMPQQEIVDETKAPAGVVPSEKVDAGETATPEAEVLQQENAVQADEGRAVRASQGRVAARKGRVPIDALVSKVRTLQQEADAANQKLKDAQVAASAATAAAKRASTELIRRQCEDRLAELEAEIPKRPPPKFNMFKSDFRLPGENPVTSAKKYAEMWAALGAEEKQKYNDRHAAENKRFVEWSQTEAGRKNLAERTELLRKCREAGGDELERVMQAVEQDKATGAINSPPAKRAKKAEQASSMQSGTPDSPPAKGASAADQTPAKERPTKASRAKGETSTLDEAVVAEATEAKLLEQLRNLADRPEVLALGKSGSELLAALQKNEGMVNAAKRALLGV